MEGGDPPCGIGAAEFDDLENMTCGIAENGVREFGVPSFGGEPVLADPAGGELGRDAQQPDIQCRNVQVVGDLTEVLDASGSDAPESIRSPAGRKINALQVR